MYRPMAHPPRTLPSTIGVSMTAIICRAKGTAPTMKIGGMTASTAMRAAKTATSARSVAWNPLRDDIGFLP